MAGKGTPTCFISYSWDSEDHRQWVRELAVRLRSGGVDATLDQWHAVPGDQLPEFMERSIRESDFVLVVCTPKYKIRSDQRVGGVGYEGDIITGEVFKNRENRKFIPLLRFGKWGEAAPSWLLGRAYIDFRSEMGSLASYNELLMTLHGNRPQPPPIGERPFPTSRVQVFPTRLPRTGKHLVGREEELKALTEAWQNPRTHVVQIVASGGVGKTQLVKTWRETLEEDGFGGANRSFDWSFHSQGTNHEGTSADVFFDEALQWFGHKDPASIRLAWEKGECLAQLVRSFRTLLILDGLEPLQHPPGPREGCLTDQALEALIKSLSSDNSGLCVITTRIEIAELEGRKFPRCLSLNLQSLKPSAGAQLLRLSGANGNQEALEQTSVDYDGHALALILLGTYLRDRYGGEISHRDRLDSRRSFVDAVHLLKGQERYSAHARKMMASYVEWFERSGKADNVSRAAVTILRLMGLFDRPADAGCVKALRSAPIAGLTEPLFMASNTSDLWENAVLRLRSAKLLSEADFTDRFNALDTHPLVREYFAGELSTHFDGPSKAAHKRLFEFLQGDAREQPDNLSDMIPLYHAVAHGSKASMNDEAVRLYVDRIQRGSSHFAQFTLGSYRMDLQALLSFVDANTGEFVGNISHENRAFVTKEIGYCLRAKGELDQSVFMLKRAAQCFVDLEDWTNAALSAGTQSHVLTTLGELDEAREAAIQSVDLANRTNSQSVQSRHRVILAIVFHELGDLNAALSEMEEAERLQLADQKSRFSLLHPVRSYDYSSVLLSLGRLEEARARTEQTLEWAGEAGDLTNIALDSVILGRVIMATTRDPKRLISAEAYLNEAISTLRTAGRQDFVPLGYLARAALYRLINAWERAANDIESAEGIAKTGPMRLHLTDCCIERARLALARRRHGIARDWSRKALALVETCGYGRRRVEISKLMSEIG